MSYKNEEDVKQALGIDSWRNLSKAKIIKFAAMMPDMDTEVALKIVEQFPVFKEFATDAIDAMEKAHKSTLKANKQSQQNVHQAFQEIREILKGELDRDELSEDMRRFIIEQIQETGKQESQKDSENKKFLDAAMSKVMVGAAAVVALGIVFVGGKIMAGSEDRPDSSLDA